MASAKDFNQTAANIAAVVRNAKDSWEGLALDVALKTAREIASQMAAGYAQENGRFDRERFMAACGF
jgi:hypothetical protein